MQNAMPNAIPRFLADHTALDLLNTVEMIDGKQCDLWHTSDDVKLWLSKVGLLLDAKKMDIQDSLLDEARTLRETVRELVASKKAGRPLTISKLNDYLAQSCSYPALKISEGGVLSTARIYQPQTAGQLLGPLAEQAADLLANVDFGLVRECENHECCLWFYDKTKSHRRRWCSMAVCGNRHKVAKFRQNQKDAE
ncbi:putative RNA-binding Zn ribbon-like protein [Sodalis ligni]|uniref:Putative RNA-binding Zn ribbon-like protein n=2 Tax=Sodalis ligni TaxID=2697027 RepID=A0A4R1NN10_9GAMM|nr:putative RNA-binding Zn ribbon-like protein [Sodalis ligni]